MSTIAHRVMIKYKYSKEQKIKKKVITITINKNINNLFRNYQTLVYFRSIHVLYLVNKA